MPGDADSQLLPRSTRSRLLLRKTYFEASTPPVLASYRLTVFKVVNPGGLLVHEQFWDLEFGVADSFGIHGLWPDMCNGKYLNSCDSSRAYSGNEIVQALQNAGQGALVQYMETYWVSDTESPTSFWAHEWGKHGTW